MTETSTTGTTSATTAENTTTQTLPNGWNEHQWKWSIKEQAHYTYAESYIFDEYDVEVDRYNFYFHDLDGEYGCYSFSSQEINRFILFLRHCEAEKKYIRVKRDMR